MESVPLDLNLVVYILSALLVFLALWIVRLEVRLFRLLKGQNGTSLEATIYATKKGQEELEKFRKELENYLENVEKRLKKSTQGVSTLRFNPFKGRGQGGNQSFAVGLLNEEGDGVVFSSLYARERMSVFAKPVKGGVSEFELTAEEKQAIEQAKKIMA